MAEHAVFSRRSVSAFPLAAVSTATLAFAGDQDVELISLGREWEAVCDQADALYRSLDGVPEADLRHKIVDARTDDLFGVEMKLFDAIVAMPAQSLRGLAVKAWVVARANDCEKRDRAAIEEAMQCSDEFSKDAVFSLLLDIVRLAT